MSDILKEGQNLPNESQPVDGGKRVWPIFALITGNVVSYVGNTLTLLAIPWFVLQTTHNVVLAGVVGFASVLSRIVSGTLSGVLVERFGYKRTSVLGDLLSGLIVILIPLLYHTVGLAFWELLVLVFLANLLMAPASTARFALIPNLAELARMRLERANSFEEGALRVSAFIGASLAGFLIAVVGASNLLWLDAASFFISALLIGLSVPEHVPGGQASAGSKAKTAPQQSYFAALGEGLRFSKESGLLLLVFIFLIMNMLDQASSAVVLPDYSLTIYKSAIPLGLFVALEGGAGFLGTMIVAVIGHRLPRRQTLAVGFIAGGALSYWVLLIPNFPLQLSCFVLSGLLMSPINPLIFTIIQEITPRHQLGRVAGVGRAMVQAGMPLGALAGGFGIAALGLRTTLIIMGAIALIITPFVLVDPRLKTKKKAAGDTLSPTADKQLQESSLAEANPLAASPSEAIVPEA